MNTFQIREKISEFISQFDFKDFTKLIEYLKYVIDEFDDEPIKIYRKFKFCI